MAGKVRLKQVSADGANNGDLCTYDSALSKWKPVTPAAAAPPGSTVQAQFAELTSDTTTTSTTFVSLFSINITVVAGSSLHIWMMGSCSTATGNKVIDFRIKIDGAVQRGIGTTTSGAGQPSSVGMLYNISGLSAGSHTVLIEWRVSSGTAQIRPVTVPDSESMSLLVEEIKP